MAQKPVPVRTEQKMAGFCIENTCIKSIKFLLWTEDEKQTHFLQNVSKQNTASHAHLAPQVCAACAVWCSMGHKE